jgi:hypothetical protein
VTPKSGLFLLGCCISAIASVGCIFELTSGTPELGVGTTSAILAAAIPLTFVLFWAAVQDARSSMK